MNHPVRNRMTSVFLVVTIICLLLAGCVPQDPASSSQQEPVTLTVQVNRTRYTNGLKRMIQKLEQEENIKIDCQIIPDDQSPDIIKMRINSGEAPDLIDTNIPNVYGQVVPEEYLVDFSDQEWNQRLINPDVASYNGKTYGFPFQAIQNVHVFIYNRDVFAQAGIQETPSSWEELLEVCEKIKQNCPGVTPIYMPQDKWVCQILAASNFETVLGPERSQETLQKLLSNQLKWTEIPEFSSVLDHYLELFQKGYINSDYLNTDYENTVDAVGQGKAAMHFNGNPFVSTVKNEYPDSDIGMFELNMPGCPSDIVAGNLNSIGFVVPKTTEKLDVIRKVFSLWSTPEYLNLYFQDNPGFPAFTGVDGGAHSEDLVQLTEEYVNTGKVYPDFLAQFGPVQTCIDGYLWVYLVEMPAQPGMTGQKILERFQADYEAYMVEQGAERFSQ